MPILQHILDAQFAGILDQGEVQGIRDPGEVIGRLAVRAAFRHLPRSAGSRDGDDIASGGAGPPGIAFSIVIQIDVK